MLRRSIVRLLAIPVASLGVAAGTAVAAPSAFAAVSETGGTVTLTAPFSDLTPIVEDGVIACPVSPATGSADTSNDTASLSFTVTGGDADVTKAFGTADLGGSLEVESPGHEVTFTNWQLNVRGATITATPSGSSTPVTLLDLRGTLKITASSTQQTLSSTEVEIDPAGASYLDSTLDTSAFSSGQQIGSLSASWTITGS
jgi:hypothetical protein